MADLRIKDLGTAASINADDYIVLDGASRGSAVKFDANSLGSSNDRVFADDATVAPANAGLPTVSEIQAFVTAGGYTDTLVYYTGTNTDTDTPTYAYMVDKSGVVTQVEGVVQSTQSPIYTGKSTTFAGLPTTRLDSSALIAGDRAALTKDVKGTGTKANPQYKAGMYFYDGSAWGFGYEFDSTRDADVLLDWTASTDYLQGETVLINGDLYVSNSERTSGATLDATEEGNFTQVSTKPNARLFADDTTVAPSVSSTPTLAEIKAFIDTIPYVDGIVYYTGTDVDTDAPTYVYDVDKDGVVTVIVEPSEASKKLTDTEVYLSPSGAPYVVSERTTSAGNRTGLTQIGRTYIPSVDSTLVSIDALYLNSDQTGDLVDVYIYKGIGSSGVLLDTISSVALGGIGSILTVTPNVTIVMNAGETYSYNVVKQSGTMDIQISNVAYTDGGVFADGGASDGVEPTSAILGGLTISEAVTYNVFYETVDDVTVTKYAVNKDDVTDQPDISAGIPATWTLQSSADSGLNDYGILPASVVSKGVYSADGSIGSASLYQAQGLLGRVVVSTVGSGVGTVIGVKAGESLNGVTDGTYTTQSDGELLEFVDNGVGQWTVQVLGSGNVNNVFQTQTETLVYGATAVESVSYSADTASSSIVGLDLKITRSYIGNGMADVTIVADSVELATDNLVTITLPTDYLTTFNYGSVDRDTINATNQIICGSQAVDTFFINRDNNITGTSNMNIIIKGQGKWVGEEPNPVVMSGMVTVEDLVDTLYEEVGTWTSGSTGAIYAWDGGYTWADIVAKYDFIEIWADTNVHGGAGRVSVQSLALDADYGSANVVTIDFGQYGSRAVTLELLTRPTDTTFSLDANGVTPAQGLRVMGIKKQKTVIPASNTITSDNSASGYFDIGNMRLQWGTNTEGTGTRTITFHVPFADSSYSLSTTAQSGIATATFSFNEDPANKTASSTTGEFLYNNSSSVSQASEDFAWQAVGLRP